MSIHLSQHAKKQIDDPDTDSHSYKLEYTKNWVNSLPSDVFPLEDFDNFEARCQTEQKKIKKKLPTKAKVKKRTGVQPKRKPGALNIKLKQMEMHANTEPNDWEDESTTSNTEFVRRELTEAEKVKVIIKRLVCQNTNITEPKKKQYPENPVRMDDSLRQELELKKKKMVLDQIEILWKFQSSCLLKNCNNFPKDVDMSPNQKYIYCELLKCGKLPKMIIQYIRILEKRKLESENYINNKIINWELQSNKDKQSKMDIRKMEVQKMEEIGDKELETTEMANKTKTNEKNELIKVDSKVLQLNKKKKTKSTKIVGKGKRWAMKLIGDANLTPSQENHLITEKMLATERRLSSSRITTSFSSDTLTEGEDKQALTEQQSSVIEIKHQKKTKPSKENKITSNYRKKRQNQILPSVTSSNATTVPKRRVRKKPRRRKDNIKQKQYSEVDTASEGNYNKISSAITTSFSNLELAQKSSTTNSVRVIENVRVLRISDTDCSATAAAKYKKSAKQVSKKTIPHTTAKNKTNFHEVKKEFKKISPQTIMPNASDKQGEKKKPVAKMQPWARKIFARNRNKNSERSAKKVNEPSEQSVPTEKIMKFAESGIHIDPNIPVYQPAKNIKIYRICKSVAVSGDDIGMHAYMGNHE